MTDDFKMIHVHKFNDVQKQLWDGNDEPYLSVPGLPSASCGNGPW